jgi:hypothetical protein
VKITDGKNECITSDDGTASLNIPADNLANIQLIYGEKLLDKDRYTLTIKGNEIVIIINYDVTQDNCDHDQSSFESTPEGLSLSVGGTWDGASKGYACLDDNGSVGIYIFGIKVGSIRDTFLGSDCMRALIHCITDHAYPEHGCYHHHGNKTCSTILGHSQTRHTH